MAEKEDAGRKAALESAIAAITKQFGSGAIMTMGGENALGNVEVVPTGILSVDIALGGGIPRGRIVEIYGPESSGKTTLATHMIGQVQKRGGLAAFVDAEHAFDPEYAKILGVDLEHLLVSQPDTGEQALEITETLVRSNAVDVIVIDSVAALVPRAEIEGEMGDAMVGVQARLMSQALRKLTGAISKSKTTVIFINQIRMKIGVMFGNPETTSGGNALKFYASVRIEIRKKEIIKDGDNAVGIVSGIKVVKNKIAPPFRTALFDLLYGEGISREGDLLDTGANLEIIRKSGAWYYYGEEKLGQGKEGAREYLKANPDIFKKIDHEIRVKVGFTKTDKNAAVKAEKPELEAASEAPEPATESEAKPAKGKK